jgi:Tfp pilus assembly protein PilF
MMSLVGRMLEDTGIVVASERAVLTAIGDQPVPTPMTTDFLDRVTGISASGAVLDLSLNEENGLFRLSATLAAADGERTRRVIVGDSPAAVAADMSRIIGSVLDTSDGRPDRRLRRVSADPFINEAYARALDLELQGELEEARTLFRVAAEQEPDLFWLRYEIALCTRDLREWDNAETMFADLHREATAAGDGSAQIATLNSLGVMHLNREDFESAKTALESAIAIEDPGASAADRATVHINLALIASNQDDRETARAHYEFALAEFDAAELSPPPTFYNNFAGLLAAEGQLERAQSYAEQAVAGFQLRGQRRFEASALNRLGRILRRRGDLDGALLRHEQALAIQRDLDNALGEVIVMMAMTNVYRDKGDLTRARLNAVDARDRAETLDHLGLKADARMYLAQVDEDLGNHAAARDGYVAARNIFETQGTPPGLRYADESIARTTFLIGDTAQARMLAAELVESAEQSGDARAAGRARRLVAQIDHAEGDSKKAIAELLRVLAAAEARDDELMVAGTTAELADIYLDAGMTPEAAALIHSQNESDLDPDHARLRARLAHAEGDDVAAAAIMSALRQTAGEAWSDEDQALLERYQAASGR